MGKVTGRVNGKAEKKTDTTALKAEVAALKKENKELRDQLEEAIANAGTVKAPTGGK